MSTVPRSPVNDCIVIIKLMLVFYVNMYQCNCTCIYMYIRVQYILYWPACVCVLDNDEHVTCTWTGQHVCHNLVNICLLLQEA